MTPDDAPHDERPVREVGRIGRAHGVRGEVRVRLLTERAERLAPGAAVRVGHGWHTVSTARPVGDEWLVRFVGVDDRSAAERLAHLLLFAEADDSGAAEGDLWVHDLIGRQVVDQHGAERGECVAVVANPGSDLLELASGALVPVVFVRGLRDGAIDVDVPEGLFDL